MTYKDQLLALAVASEHDVLAIWDQWVAGMPVDQAVAYIAALIAQANSEAVALADLAVAASVMIQIGQAVPVVGLTPPVGDLDRLGKAARTVLDVADDSPVPDRIVARLARCEPLETAARAVSEAMEKQPAVKGWVRQTSESACELCRDWARGGHVWPSDHPMPHHKGCSCTPRVVVREQKSTTRRGRR